MRLRWPRCGHYYPVGEWIPQWAHPEGWHVCARPRFHGGKHEGPAA